MPPGVKLNVLFPDGKVGDLFEVTSDQVDLQISKLVLGNTGTTEADEANRASSVIQKGEQNEVVSRDAQALSARIQQQLVKPFVELNWGTRFLDHAPRFGLRADPPRNTEKELRNAQLTLAMGLPVAEQQLREISGLRRPHPGETYVLQSAGGTDALGNPTPGQSEVIDPETQDENTLEEGGEDLADANAVADLLAASGVRLSGTQRRGLSLVPAATRSAVATALVSKALTSATDDGRWERQRAQLATDLVVRAGIQAEHAERAVDAASGGRLGELRTIPGLGMDDALWLAERAPARFGIRVPVED